MAIYSAHGASETSVIFFGCSCAAKECALCSQQTFPGFGFSRERLFSWTLVMSTLARAAHSGQSHPHPTGFGHSPRFCSGASKTQYFWGGSQVRTFTCRLPLWEVSYWLCHAQVHLSWSGKLEIKQWQCRNWESWAQLHGLGLENPGSKEPKTTQHLEFWHRGKVF